jgi:hypothetical protein
MYIYHVMEAFKSCKKIMLFMDTFIMQVAYNIPACVSGQVKELGFG